MTTDQEGNSLPQSGADLKGLLPKTSAALFSATPGMDEEDMVLVVGKHRFYNQLYLEVVTAKSTSEGKLKNPLTKIQVARQLWKSAEPDVLKFFSAVLYFQNNYSEERSAADFDALRALVKNPLKLRCFMHDSKLSSNITASSVLPQRIQTLVPDIRLTVSKIDTYYEVSGKINIDGKAHSLENIVLKLYYFIQQGSVLYLVDNPYLLHVISFFKKHQGRLVMRGCFPGWRRK